MIEDDDDDDDDDFVSDDMDHVDLDTCMFNLIICLNFSTIVPSSVTQDQIGAANAAAGIAGPCCGSLLSRTAFVFAADSLEQIDFDEPISDDDSGTNLVRAFILPWLDSCVLMALLVGFVRPGQGEVRRACRSD